MSYILSLNIHGNLLYFAINLYFLHSLDNVESNTSLALNMQSTQLKRPLENKDSLISDLCQRFFLWNSLMRYQ